MFNIHDMVDSKEYLQDQDQEIWGFLRAVCTGGSEASPLPSRQETHGINNTTSRPIWHHWVGGSGQNWTTGQGLPFKSHKTFTSSQDARIQDAPEAMGIFSSHEQVQEQITFPKEAKGNPQDPG
jgi:hypothetical protein